MKIYYIKKLFLDQDPLILSGSRSYVEGILLHSFGRNQKKRRRRRRKKKKKDISVFPSQRDSFMVTATTTTSTKTVAGQISSCLEEVKKEEKGKE